jgi:hypothetical protein
MSESTQPAALQAMWIEGSGDPDSHVAFRGTFDSDGGEIDLSVWGAAWFVVWMDGKRLLEGPTRSEGGRHEAVQTPVKLPAGRHVIAVQVQHVGVPTRMLPDQPPFLACRMKSSGKEIEIAWKAAALAGYSPRVRRINPELAWIDWVDTRNNPANWIDPAFDDSAWKAPTSRDTGKDIFTAALIGPVHSIDHSLIAFAEGKLAEMFGYELDDIPARFFLRDLNCTGLPPQGAWRRFDLDRVRLGRLNVTLEAPAGAIVEMAYSESLASGRVQAWVSLSAGPSCNFDHFVARGGRQEFCAHTPKGGRFIEIHVLGDPDKIKFIDSRYIERTYHYDAFGSFSCDDEMLNRIWKMCVETYRACSEDAIIDNPTRERGQWTGDSYIGMETAAVAFGDLRLARRALTMAARDARDDGLVSGLTPGLSPMSTYGAQWVNACVRYFQISGDRSLLEEYFAYAKKNMAAFEGHLKQIDPHPITALSDDMGWGFVDWGYARPPGPVDLAVNLHYLSALQAMTKWCEILGKPADKYTETAKKIHDACQWMIMPHLAPGGGQWKELGYHVAALSLRANLLDAPFDAGAVQFMQDHWKNCFPNNADAPRLSDPSVSSKQIVTPYFAHYAFPQLIERGQGDFVLDQYRAGWGWMLNQGFTTCTEVFDPRWSHCHQWAGCPAWQMSRYVLGLHSRFDRSEVDFDLNLRPGSLKRAAGKLPFIGGLIEIKWERAGDKIKYELNTPRAIRVALAGGQTQQVDDRMSIDISDSGK